MKIAYLILVHKGPEQVERLIKKLTCEAAHFYIHLDQKADISNFTLLQRLDHVYFIRKRFSINWAGYSMVRAMIESSREILNSGNSYDFISTISGQDYPIKSNQEILSFFSNHLGYSFMHLEEHHSVWWSRALQRYEKYHLTDFHFSGKGRVEILLNMFLPKRKLPLPNTMEGGPGSQWWSLSTESLAYVVKFFDDHPNLHTFWRFTWGGDEFIISTILMNSPFSGKIVKDNMRYMNWLTDSPNPKILTTSDFVQLKSSSYLFARKFDVAQDAKILDLLDELHELQHS